MNKKLFLPLIFLVILVLGFSPTSEGKAADGTTGILTAGNDQYYEHSAVTLTMTGLTGGADYALNITAGCWVGADTNNQYLFTTGTAQTRKTITLEDLLAPTSGRVCTIMLVQQSAGTEIDRVELHARKVDEGLPIAFILAIAIPVIIFLVVLGIAKRFAA